MSEADSSRRRFLKQLSLLTGFYSLGAVANSDLHIDFDEKEIGIMQGFTNSSQTTITVVAHQKRVFEFEIVPETSVEINKINFGYSDFIIYQLKITGLKLKTNYELHLKDKNTGEIESRYFSALDLANQNPKLALISCANHRNAKPQATMCRKLAEQNLDAILFFGDLVYANSVADTILNRPAPPDSAYEKYVKTFLEINMYSWEKLIPVFSVWDDHDTGMNNATSSHPNLALMGQMFRSFFPLDATMSEVKQGPGQSFLLNAFGIQIFFLDGRSFVTRSTYLGPQQMEWLSSHYNKSSGPLLIISPQVVQQYTAWGSSFQQISNNEFQQLKDWILANPRPFFFISGDMHYSQIQFFDKSTFGFPTFEVTSSALFSSSSGPSGKRTIESGQLEYFGFANFVVLDRLKIAAHSLSAQFTCVSEKSDSEFSQNIGCTIEKLAKKKSA